MSIIRADNFDNYALANSTAADISSAAGVLTATGRFSLRQSSTGYPCYLGDTAPSGKALDPEGKTWVTFRTTYGTATTGWRGIALENPTIAPNTGRYFLSLRTILPATTTFGGFIAMAIGLIATNGTTPAYNILNTSGPDLYAFGAVVPRELSKLSEATYTPLGIDIQIDTDTGEIIVWIDNRKIGSATVSVANMGGIFLGTGKTITTNSGAATGTWYFRDLALVKSDGAGHVYRLGPGFRVQNVEAAADVKAEWAAPSDWTGTHAALMSRPLSATAATTGLSGVQGGQTEQYSVSDLDPALGSRVAGVLAEVRVGNQSGVRQTLEVISGDTPLVAGSKDYAAGAALAFSSVPLPVNPATGQAWTVAEVNALTAGFRVKNV